MLLLWIFRYNRRLVELWMGHNLSWLVWYASMRLTCIASYKCGAIKRVTCLRCCCSLLNFQRRVKGGCARCGFLFLGDQLACCSRHCSSLVWRDIPTRVFNSCMGVYWVCCFSIECRSLFSTTCLLLRYSSFWGVRDLRWLWSLYWDWHLNLLNCFNNLAFLNIIITRKKLLIDQRVINLPISIRICLKFARVGISQTIGASMVNTLPIFRVRTYLLHLRY